MHILKEELDSKGVLIENAQVELADGDGTGKPLGIFAKAGGGQVGVTTASGTEITADEIINLVYAERVLKNILKSIDSDVMS